MKSDPSAGGNISSYSRFCFLQVLNHGSVVDHRTASCILVLKQAPYPNRRISMLAISMLAAVHLICVCSSNAEFRTFQSYGTWDHPSAAFQTWSDKWAWRSATLTIPHCNLAIYWWKCYIASGFIFNQMDFKGGNHIWAGEVNHRPFQIAFFRWECYFPDKIHRHSSHRITTVLLFLSPPRCSLLLFLLILTRYSLWLH